MSRGNRLHIEKCIKERIKKRIKETWHDSTIAEDKKIIGKIAHTPHGCSCRCCGNPRRMEKGIARLTMQELKQIEKDQI